MNLLGNIFSEIIAHIVGDSRHDKALNEVQASAQKIQPRQKEKDLSHFSKINASCSIYPRHQAVENLCGGVAEDRWSPDGKHRAGHREDHHQKKTEFVTFHIIQQFFHAGVKILGFFAGHSSSAHPAHAASLITHDPIPPLKAEMPRSDGKLRRILTVLCGCRYRRSVPHPER